MRRPLEDEADDIVRGELLRLGKLPTARLNSVCCDEVLGIGAVGHREVERHVRREAVSVPEHITLKL